MPSGITKIRAKNFRCFRDTTELTLKPVNILVGENSAGKSSVLALSRIIGELVSGRRPDFNTRPFFLGSYDEIAFNIGGKGGRQTSFSVSAELELESWDFPRITKRKSEQAKLANLLFQFENRNSQPTIVRMDFDFAEYGFASIDFANGTVNFDYVKRDARKKHKSINFHEGGVPNVARHLRDAYFAFSKITSEDRKDLKKDLNQDLMNLFERVMYGQGGISVYAASPIRSNPRRTYDPVASSVTDDSNYALQSLASLKRTRQKEWDGLKQAIAKAGELAGLFRDFDIRLLGKNESDPFQAQVKIGGKKVNIVDVGFGVSQLIPAIYDLLVVRSSLILVQQPEIHLHPKAQSGLGEIVASLPSQKKDQTYMIETHSDYLEPIRK